MLTAQEHKNLENLLQSLDPQSRLLRTWPLKGGVSARMIGLEVALPQGQTKKLVLRQPGAGTLKRNPQAAAQEFRLLQILRFRNLPTQAPYHLDQSGRFFAQPSLLLEYIEGEPEFSPTDLALYLFEFAARLAGLHEVRGSNPELSFLPDRTKRLARLFANPPANVDQSPHKRRIRETLASLWPPPALNKPVLLHGDFWPGNLLRKNGRYLVIIDWEDAELGDPLADVAISRLEILWLFGFGAMQSFTWRYQTLTSIDFTALPYWDLCAALRPPSNYADWASGWPELGRPDITADAMREGHEWFIWQAFEELSYLGKR